jgi:hypothetical protein
VLEQNFHYFGIIHNFAYKASLTLNIRPIINMINILFIINQARRATIWSALPLALTNPERQ